MAWYLFGAKPLPKQMVIRIKLQGDLNRNYFCKTCYLGNVGHFVQASVCWRWHFSETWSKSIPPSFHFRVLYLPKCKNHVYCNYEMKCFIYKTVFFVLHMLHQHHAHWQSSTHDQININSSQGEVIVTLTHCGLVTPYGERDLGQHWLR